VADEFVEMVAEVRAIVVLDAFKQIRRLIETLKP
jgi:hypothetical protein